MNVKHPASLKRVARANPVVFDEELGRQPRAQALLTSILAHERGADTRARRKRSRGLMIIAVAALLLAAGGAFGATDPFGFWRSSRADTAMYGVDTSRHVHTPSTQQIRCEEATGATFRCGGHIRGQQYELLDQIRQQPNLSRTMMSDALDRAIRRGQLSSATARRFRADLAAVSDSFLIRLNEAMRFGTVGGGTDGKGDTTLLPPAGIPVYVVCEPAGAQLTCRNLNGDENVAVGSAIYSALPSKKWRRAPAGGGEPPSQATGRMMNAIFGHLTPAEWRLFIDLARRAGTTAHSSHASGRSGR